MDDFSWGSTRLGESFGFVNLEPELTTICVVVGDKGKKIVIHVSLLQSHDVTRWTSQLTLSSG